MEYALGIFTVIFDFMRENGVPIHIGDFNATLSFMDILVGSFIAEIGIYFLFRLFDY